MRIKENKNGYSISERQRLIYQFLLQNSNREKAVSRKRILDYLDTCDIKIHTNTLYSDIIEIQSNYGVNIKYDQKKKGYTLTGTLFEPYEIQLIAQSLQAFKYISNNKARYLTEKLKTLTGLVLLIYLSVLEDRIMWLLSVWLEAIKMIKNSQIASLFKE